MRVLSRCSNLPKAVACGYSEGAGFVVLTEPPPLGPLPLCALWATTRRRGVGELCPRAPRVCALGCLRLGHQPATGTHQLGPSAEATPRRRRGGGDSSRRRRQGGVPSAWHWGALPLPSLAAGHQQRPKKAHGDGVGRRPKTPRDGVGERSPAPATAAAALWFQSQGQSNGTAVAHARRHKHCSTAAARTAGVVHRSLRCRRDR